MLIIVQSIIVLLYSHPCLISFNDNTYADRHLLCTWIDPLHGRIACVAVGNAANNGRTIVAVLMAEGRCELLALAQGSTDGAAPLRLEVRDA